MKFIAHQNVFSASAFYRSSVEVVGTLKVIKISAHQRKHSIKNKSQYIYIIALSTYLLKYHLVFDSICSVYFCLKSCIENILNFKRLPDPKLQTNFLSCAICFREFHNPTPSKFMKINLLKLISSSFILIRCSIQFLNPLMLIYGNLFWNDDRKI